MVRSLANQNALSSVGFAYRAVGADDGVFSGSAIPIVTLFDRSPLRLCALEVDRSQTATSVECPLADACRAIGDRDACPLRSTDFGWATAEVCFSVSRPALSATPLLLQRFLHKKPPEPKPGRQRTIACSAYLLPYSSNTPSVQVTVYSPIS